MLTLDDFTVTDDAMVRFVTQQLCDNFARFKKVNNEFHYDTGVILKFSTFCSIVELEKIHRIDIDFFGEHGCLSFTDNSSMVTIPSKIVRWVQNTKHFKMIKKLQRIEQDFN